MAFEVSYRGYRVYHDPKPIPTKAHDWTYVHGGYDGPGDPRQGTAPSMEQACREVDALLEEEAAVELLGAEPRPTKEQLRGAFAVLDAFAARRQRERADESGAPEGPTPRPLFDPARRH